jgi:hypothetical protein
MRLIDYIEPIYCANCGNRIGWGNEGYDILFCDECVDVNEDDCLRILNGDV